MSEIAYINKSFPLEQRMMIAQARTICADYADQGYDLTLRQLFYQFIARDLFPDSRTWRNTGGDKWVRDSEGTKNATPNYKWLGGIINDARLAGVLDWRYIVDRTRNVRSIGHWDSPADIIRGAAQGFSLDKWADQDYRVEVWIEKDALVGVLQQCCPRLDVPYFSCRGYTSQSEIWSAAQRLGGYIDDGKKVAIIHLGDHDPSGIDMSRDVEDRLSMFIAQDRFDIDPGETIDVYQYEVADVFEVQRIALNWNQVQQYNPPPNPAKLSDSRGAGYVQRFGRSSWELDALDPPVLVALIEDAVAGYRDEERWQAAVANEAEERTILTATHDNWDAVKDFLVEEGMA